MHVIGATADTQSVEDPSKWDLMLLALPILTLTRSCVREFAVAVSLTFIAISGVYIHTRTCNIIDEPKVQKLYLEPLIVGR